MNSESSLIKISQNRFPQTLVRILFTVQSRDSVAHFTNHFLSSTAAHYPNFSFRAVAITASSIQPGLRPARPGIMALSRFSQDQTRIRGIRRRLFIYTHLGNTGGLHPLKARVHSDQVHFHRISSRVLREESVTRALLMRNKESIQIYIQGTQ